MARNKLVDLHNHLFAQMERLQDEDLKGEDLQLEIKRTKAVSDLGKQIIANASLTLDAAKMAYAEMPSGQLPDHLRVKSDVNA